MIFGRARHFSIRHYEGHAPVHAEGTINGFFFFFHARWDGWSFAISLDPEINVFGMASAHGGFYREGSYGLPGGYAASYMPEEDVEQIIRACCLQFLAEQSLS